MRAWASTVLLAALLLALAAAGSASFRGGWLLDVAAPAIGAMLVFGGMLAATLTEAQRQRQLLRAAQAKAAAELEVAQRIQSGMLPNPRTAFAQETRFRVDARVTEHIGEDPHRVTLSHSGERYLFLDHDERVFVESDRPTAAGLHARLAYDLAQLFPAPPGELQSVASRGCGLLKPTALAVHSSGPRIQT